jgi:hypothetical protein
MAASADRPTRFQSSAPGVPAQRQAPPGPPPLPEPERPPRRWPWALGGLTLGLLVGGGIGATAFAATTVVASAPVERTITIAAPAPPPQIVTVTVPAPTPEPVAAAPAGPLTAFGDGVWEVGVDVVPGKYKTAGTDSYGCYYARLQHNDGSISDIISNGFGQGPVTVTIKDSDGYFETSGCVDWTKAG